MQNDLSSSAFLFCFVFFKFKTFLIYILSVTTISSQRGSFTTFAKLIGSPRYLGVPSLLV